MLGVGEMPWTDSALDGTFLRYLATACTRFRPGLSVLQRVGS